MCYAVVVLVPCSPLSLSAESSIFTRLLLNSSHLSVYERERKREEGGEERWRIDCIDRESNDVNLTAVKSDQPDGHVE